MGEMESRVCLTREYVFDLNDSIYYEIEIFFIQLSNKFSINTSFLGMNLTRYWKVFLLLESKRPMKHFLLFG